MLTRTIANLDVGAIGLGAMPLSIIDRPSAEQAVETVYAALDAGITLIDTADAYCLNGDDVGHNERLVGEALRSWGGLLGSCTFWHPEVLTTIARISVLTNCIFASAQRPRGSPARTATQRSMDRKTATKRSRSVHLLGDSISSRLFGSLVELSDCCARRQVTA
jgi:hypothetical protein